MSLKKLVRKFIKSWNQHQHYKNWHLKDHYSNIEGKLKKQLIDKGFYPSDSIIYDFEKHGFDAFLNQRDYKILNHLNGVTSQLIDNKAFLPIILQSIPEFLPEFFAFVSNGNPKFNRGENSSSINLDKLLNNALSKHKKIIIKPTSDYGGNNILVVDKENIDQGIQKIKKGNYVINNYLENEDFIKAIHPGSLNTFRVVFFKNKLGKNEILMIAHRFGSSLSKSVDNISQGGLACSIDLETGRFSKACSYVNPSFIGWYDKHMESGAKIEGVSAPNWKKTKEDIQKIVDTLDFIEFAGLDLAFTTQGLKVIEINSKPQAQLMQVSGPALINQDFKDFIYSKGYNPKRKA